MGHHGTELPAISIILLCLLAIYECLDPPVNLKERGNHLLSQKITVHEEKKKSNKYLKVDCMISKKHGNINNGKKPNVVISSRFPTEI